MGAITRFDIADLKQRFNLSTFFETGTLHGDAVQYALDAGFERIISVEIDAELAAKARDRFADKPQVQIITGESVKVLQLYTDLDNTLFWLDAHFPGADCGKTTYKECLQLDYEVKLPLEAELNLIRKFKNVAIICDDLWIYKEGTYGAGQIDEHCARHGHNITRKEIIGDKTIQFAYDLYSDCSIREFQPDQGYLVILPNEK